MSNLQAIQMEKAHSYAKTRGGQCLSDNSEYKNSQSRLTWKCSHSDHPAWSGRFDSVVFQKSWCRKCKDVEHSRKMSKSKGMDEPLKMAQDYAFEKEGICLSTEYKNDKTLMTWKCKVSHHQSWQAKFNTLKKQHTWCKECYIERRLLNQHKPLKLIEAQQYALQKKGLCLSEEYIHDRQKLKWKCHIPHHENWEATFHNITIKDQWCPECAKVKNKTENRVRSFIEIGLQLELKSSKPEWNLNPLTGRKLELDGYNELHKLAFEHDGEHHFKPTLYNPTIPDEVFEKQAERDKIKRENCKREGVKLITIPILESKHRYKFFHLLRHVISCCREQGVALTYTYSQIKKMKQNF